LHRYLLGVTDSKIDVDHFDGDGLNNTRKNLRKTLHAQNMQNRRVNKNSKTGVRGVTIKGNKFRGRVMSGGVALLDKFYDTLDEAAAEVAAARTKYFPFSNDNTALVKEGAQSVCII
jgi:hypothetical protein